MTADQPKVALATLGAWVSAGLIGNVATAFVQTLFFCEPFHVFKPFVFEINAVFNSCLPAFIVLGSMLVFFLHFVNRKKVSDWLRFGVPVLFVVIWIAQFVILGYRHPFMDCTI